VAGRGFFFPAWGSTVVVSRLEIVQFRRLVAGEAMQVLEKFVAEDNNSCPPLPGRHCTPLDHPSRSQFADTQGSGEVWDPQHESLRFYQGCHGARTIPPGTLAGVRTANARFAVRLLGARQERAAEFCEELRHDPGIASEVSLEDRRHEARNRVPSLRSHQILSQLGPGRVVPMNGHPDLRSGGSFRPASAPIDGAIHRSGAQAALAKPLHQLGFPLSGEPSNGLASGWSPESELAAPHCGGNDSARHSVHVQPASKGDAPVACCARICASAYRLLDLPQARHHLPPSRPREHWNEPPARGLNGQRERLSWVWSNEVRIRKRKGLPPPDEWANTSLLELRPRGGPVRLVFDHRAERPGLLDDRRGLTEKILVGRKVEEAGGFARVGWRNDRPGELGS
jgi:hypothetical protein